MKKRLLSKNLDVKYIKGQLKKEGTAIFVEFIEAKKIILKIKRQINGTN